MDSHMKINIDEYTALDRYRIEGDTVIIEMGIEEPFDLYDDKDPSVLNLRDFRKEVQNYIIESIEEIPKSKKIKINIYFDKFSDDIAEVENLRQSFFDFFAFETKLRVHQIRIKIKRGFKSLAVGICFLFFCIIAAHFLGYSNKSLLSELFVEGLTVLGWVSLWTPLQVFLYEIWPLLENIKNFKRVLISSVDFKSVKNLPEPRKYI